MPVKLYFGVCGSLDGKFEKSFVRLRIVTIVIMRGLFLRSTLLQNRSQQNRCHIIIFLVTFLSVLFTKYHSGYQIKKTEMGRACGTYGGEEGWIQSFGG
jgi:hypothetical protein